MLTIGLPVYNGEPFVTEAIDSLLAQTHRDFTLVIADNCSTDGTREIALDYERRDPRVTYVRRDENIGAPANYNALAVDATTPFFKWAAADDIHAATFLERCLTILEEDASAIGAYTRAVRINERSEVIGTETYRLRTDSPDAHVRFRGITAKPHSCFSIFGVYRTELLQSTGLIRERGAGDRILLTEIALRGRTVEYPAYLLSRRVHEDSFSSGSKTGHNDPVRFWTGSEPTAEPDPAASSIEAAYLDLIHDSGLPRDMRRRCERELQLRAIRKSVLRGVVRPLRRRLNTWRERLAGTAG